MPPQFVKSSFGLFECPEGAIQTGRSSRTPRRQGQESLRQGRIPRQNDFGGSSSIKFYNTAEPADLDREDVAVISGRRCAATIGSSRDNVTMGLKQPNLDNSSNIVIVTIDSALASRAKLERFQERVLRGWGRASYRILKRVLRVRIWRSIGRRSVKLSKSRVVITCGRLELKSRTSVKCISRSSANRRKRKMHIINLN